MKERINIALRKWYQMDMVQVVHVTLDEYAVRVENFASKYHSDGWLNLNPNVMDEDDRSEFTFIKMAVGDLLVKREFFSTASPPGCEDALEESVFEPGTIPGSTVCREAFLERNGIRLTH